jgi:hypothetical protein
LEKEIVERWKWKMGWVWVFFLKALIVDGGEGPGLYFFTFFIFLFVIFLDILLLKGGGRSGLWGFFTKNHFLFLTFLIVCKFFVFFSLSKAERGRKGLRSINIICIY